MQHEKDTVSGGGGSRLNLTQKKSHPADGFAQTWH
jgi:hypothetical protein